VSYNPELYNRLINCMPDIDVSRLSKMIERRSKTVVLKTKERSEPYFGNGEKYQDESALSIIASLQEIVASVPVQYQSSVCVSIEANGGYNGDQVVVQIYYTRPETDDEAIARIQQDAIRNQFHEDRERSLYEQLRKKFETPPTSRE
jgi:hypothetical protein